MLFAAFLTVSLLALPPGVNPDLFPDVAKHAPDEIELAGLAALYPGRILHTPPRSPDEKKKGLEPMVAPLIKDKLTYLRIYDLDASLSQVGEALKKSAVILDLRYLYADAASAEKLAGLFSQAGLDYNPVDGFGSLPEPGKLPHRDSKDISPPPVVLVLTNPQTSGPLEAWLQAFQDKDSVLAVGTPTAGQPGTYQATQGYADYFMMQGELRPPSGSVAGGGVKPRFPVEVTPDQNYRAYFDVERGADIRTLLRQDRLPVPTAQSPAPTTPGVTNGNNSNTAKPVPAASAEELTDPVLQRAVDVVAALQVLGRMPSSTAPAAANAQR